MPTQGLPCRVAQPSVDDGGDDIINGNYFICYKAGACHSQTLARQVDQVDTNSVRRRRTVAETGTATSTTATQLSQLWHDDLKHSVISGDVSTTRSFPGVNGTVITRVQVAHPPWAERNVGVLAFKRVVTHWSTQHNMTVADISKNGTCVVCPDGIVPFMSPQPAQSHKGCEEVDTNVDTKDCAHYTAQTWFEQCFMKAIKDTDADGNIKSQYECKSALQPSNTNLTSDVYNNDLSGNVVPAEKAFELLMAAF